MIIARTGPEKDVPEIMWKQLKAVKRAHSPGVYQDGSRKTNGYKLICIGQRNRLI